MSLEIKHYLSQREKEEIFRLRYEVYINELGYKQELVCHNSKTLRDPLDNCGYLFGAFRNSKAIGTCLFNEAKKCDLGYYPELYKMSKLASDWKDTASISTKFIVHKRYRGSSIAFKLALAGYIKGLEDGIKYNFLDCEPEMVPFFQRLGYFLHQSEAFHPLFGKGVVMAIELQNMRRLREGRSPFLKHLQAFEVNND